MLDDCYEYGVAINVKGQRFPTKSLLMALLLSQDKIVDWLTKQISNMNNNNEVKESKLNEEEELGRAKYT